MGHIKMPIRPGGSGEKTSALYDADDKMIAFNPFRPVGPALNEIVQAVNAYAPLVAQRDDLVAQRDALVAACELALNAFEHNWAIDWSILEKALALVKGGHK